MDNMQFVREIASKASLQHSYANGIELYRQGWLEQAVLLVWLVAGFPESSALQGLEDAGVLLGAWARLWGGWLGARRPGSGGLVLGGQS